MGESHYATPNADLTAGTGAIADILKPLSDTKPWVRLCSVLGFVFTVFMLLIGLAAIVGGFSLDQVSASPGMPIGGLGFFYVVMAFFYFLPSLYLFKYANAIASAEISHSAADIAIAAGYQKSFWKFVGIFALIMTIVMVIGIGAAIILPMFVA
jgi:hypothetical protein